MVRVIYANRFEREMKKLEINKIITNPKVGKPMRHNRKNTREVYISPFRLSYSYSEKEDLLTFLDVYHKKEQ